MMDQNKPARFLDTAYNALKTNPGATNQILQAAAQGQPVGLRGLAAAAAQQSQQEAQKAMTALQQQGPQPNIIQKLAQSGIMSQMDTGLPMAPQMGAPEEMPQQMMAGGGLVSFADGGNVLPPDVIDAIQSHFAEGGEVRGFAYGDNVELSDFERRHPEVLEDTIGSRWKDVIGGHIQTDEDILGPIIDRWKAMHASHMKNDEDLARGFKQTWEESTAPIGGAIDRTPRMSESDYGILEGKGAFGPRPPSTLDNIIGALTPHRENPPISSAPATETEAMPSSPTEQDLARLNQLTENYPRNGILAAANAPAKSQDAKPQGAKAEPVTWKPGSHDRHEVTPRQRVIEEGTKVDKPFKEAKTDVPSAAVTPDSENLGGLAALSGMGNLEQMRDLIAGLGGHKEMSPEMLQRLGDLESSARTSTILQSVLGGLAGGLSNPYGGRFALGQAALGALGGYQKGIGSEEEIGRKAFDVLRGYADAPEEEKTKARDLLLNQLGDTAKLQSARDIAEMKGGFEDKLALETYKERNRLLNPQVHGGALAPRGSLTQGDQANLMSKAIEQARKDAADAANTPPFKTMSDAEQNARARQYYNQYLAAGQNTGLGGNISATQAGGLGGGSIPIYTR